MSQDLFAEFGSFASSAPQRASSTASHASRGHKKRPSLDFTAPSVLDRWSAIAESTDSSIPRIAIPLVDDGRGFGGGNVEGDDEEDDDEFGDFEDAGLPSTASTAGGPIAAQAPTPTPVPAQSRYTAPDLKPFRPRLHSIPSASLPSKPRAEVEKKVTQSNFPFKPKPQQTASASKQETGNYPFKPKPEAQETGNYPFKPKAQSLKSTGAAKPAPQHTTPWVQASNRHPFADHMDVLFAAEEEEYSAGKDEWNDLSNDPEAAVAYSKRVIAEQMALRERDERAVFAQPTAESTPKPARERDPNVLFDAEDPTELDGETGDGDDFGEFNEFTGPKNGSGEVAQPSVVSAMDLLGLDDDVSPPAGERQNGHAPSTSWASTRVKTSPMSQQPLVVDDDDDDEPWDDFEEAVPVALPKFGLSTTIEGTRPTSQTSSVLPAISKERIRRQPSPHLVTPPTNIPPPSLLLSLFPPLMTSTPSTTSFEAHLSLIRTLSHILAGRRQRWKRDTHLAQSMRIGPASSNGSHKAGMKLTTIDKTEIAKEDREVAEVLRIWKSQVGKLRAAAVGKGRVPDVKEVMTSKMLSEGEGGVKARMACALCGLKREERILGCDEDVLDGFDEWWIESAGMHAGCEAFWRHNGEQLRGR